MPSNNTKPLFHPFLDCSITDRHFDTNDIDEMDASRRDMVYAKMFRAIFFPVLAQLSFPSPYTYCTLYFATLYY